MIVVVLPDHTRNVIKGVANIKQLCEESAFNYTVDSVTNVEFYNTEYSLILDLSGTCIYNNKIHTFKSQITCHSYGGAENTHLIDFERVEIISIHEEEKNTDFKDSISFKNPVASSNNSFYSNVAQEKPRYQQIQAPMITKEKYVSTQVTHTQAYHNDDLVDNMATMEIVIRFCLLFYLNKYLY